MTDKTYEPELSHTIEQQANQAVESAPPSTEPAWFLDDNTPGNGARPDWLPAKYKKASDVGKAYSELEKRLGGFTGAPDKYDVASLELDEGALIVKEMMEVGKELNMSQEAFNKFIGRLASANETESNSHLEEQIEKMGKDGQRMLVEYKNWTKDYLKPEEREVVSDWVKTADDLKVFNRMMAHTHMSAVPTAQSMNMANNFESVKDLRAELSKNIDRYDKDKNYQKDWSSRMNKAVTREGGG